MHEGHQRITITRAGVYVNDLPVPGFIEADTVSVTPTDRGGYSRVHLTLIADSVHITSDAPQIPEVDRGQAELRHIP